MGETSEHGKGAECKVQSARGFLSLNTKNMLVSWFLGFTFRSSKASKFQSFKVSVFQNFKDAKTQIMFFDRYWSHITKFPPHVFWMILIPYPRVSTNILNGSSGFTGARHFYFCWKCQLFRNLKFHSIIFSQKWFVFLELFEIAWCLR